MQVGFIHLSLSFHSCSKLHTCLLLEGEREMTNCLQILPARPSDIFVITVPNTFRQVVYTTATITKFSWLEPRNKGSGIWGKDCRIGREASKGLPESGQWGTQPAKWSQARALISKHSMYWKLGRKCIISIFIGRRQAIALPAGSISSIWSPPHINASKRPFKSLDKNLQRHLFSPPLNESSLSFSSQIPMNMSNEVRPLPVPLMSNCQHCKKCYPVNIHLMPHHASKWIHRS